MAATHSGGVLLELLASGPFLLVAYTYWLASIAILAILTLVSRVESVRQIPFVHQVLSWGKLLDTTTAASADGQSSSRAASSPREHQGQGSSPASPPASRVLLSLAWARVPKRYFAHFYLLGSLWNAALIAHTLQRCSLSATLRAAATPTAGGSHSGGYLGGGTSEFEALLALLCLQFQLMRRAYECQFVSVFSDGSMHLAHYLVGLSFYFFAPASLAASSPQLVNGPCSSQLDARALDETLVHGFLRSANWRHWLGLELFFFANLHQFRCHSILASLRTSRNTGSGYFLPQGDWFERIGSPHYFAEILIYASLALIVHGASLPVLCAAFVFANLSLGAWLTDKWYRERFPGYNRCVLVPFVW